MFGGDRYTHLVCSPSTFYQASVCRKRQRNRRTGNRCGYDSSNLSRAIDPFRSVSFLRYTSVFIVAFRSGGLRFWCCKSLIIRLSRGLISTDKSRVEDQLILSALRGRRFKPRFRVLRTGFGLLHGAPAPRVKRVR